MPVAVVERGIEVAVVQLLPVQALVQVHRVRVVHQPGLQRRGVVDLPGGHVADPGAARLRTARIDGQVARVGRTRVVADLVAGEAPGCFVIGLAVTHEKAGFQLRGDLPAEVGHRAFAVAGGMALVAVRFGVGVGQVVVDIAAHPAVADAALLVATAARFVLQLQPGRIAPAAAHVIDRTTQRQRAALEAVGAAQHLGPAQPQRFQQFVRRAPRAGQWKAVDRHRDAGSMRARAAVDARASDRHLGAFVARRLRADAGLIGQHIGAGGQPAVGLGQVHHVARAGNPRERRPGLFGLVGSGHVDRVQGGGLWGGLGGGGKAEGDGHEQQRRGGAERREMHVDICKPKNRAAS
ncbi:hypothetical protein D3C71_1047660 [compost metagenome]